MLEDINKGTVFDDILVEFDQIWTRSLVACGYDTKKVMKGIIIPSYEDGEKLSEDLNEYYDELLQVVAKRYEEVKVILETHFRELISIKRDQLDLKHQQETLNGDSY